jgi:hypothetical protein
MILSFISCYHYILNANSIETGVFFVIGIDGLHANYDIGWAIPDYPKGRVVGALLNGGVSPASSKALVFADESPAVSNLHLLKCVPRERPHGCRPVFQPEPSDRIQATR